MAQIAIVDDSKLARVFAAATLAKNGHTVVEIEPTDLVAVLAQLREKKPDLLVLDHNMPAFSGPSLVRACFEDETLSSLKVVMLTAHHDDEMRSRMYKLGVHAVLYKPIGAKDLASCVAGVLKL